ncbi:MAG: hypothetical protein PUC41_04545 [Oscillospiraceae bacterium]|nr:hypothetical protein [Oscillospiraceae bacterium]
MQKSIRKGFSALTAAALTLSALSCQLTSVQAADPANALLNTADGAKEISFDLSSIDVTAVDRIDATISADTGEGNGCFGYNVENPDATGEDDKFNWESVKWAFKASPNAATVVSADNLAGTMSQDSANIMFQFWWIQSFYDENGDKSGDGSALLHDVTLYDVNDNILGYFGTYEDALLTAKTGDDVPTYNFNFVGIDPTAVDKIEADIAVNTGFVNGAIGYTDTTIEVDPTDEASTNWVSVDQETNGLYDTWVAEGLAGKLDADYPSANLQLWYINPFYDKDSGEVDEDDNPIMVEGTPGTAQIMAVRYYDKDGNELIPLDINSALLERTSDETGDTAYVIPFTGIDASIIDRIEAGVYVDSAYANGCIGYTDATVDMEEEGATNWVSVECVSEEESSVWTISGLAGKLDADHPAAQVQFWHTNPFYDKDSGAVDEDGNPIMEAGSVGTAKLIYVNLYTKDGSLITPVNTDDYLAMKYGNEKDTTGSSSVAYVVDMTDVDATKVASMELFFNVDTEYVNGAIGYADADDAWNSVSYTFNGNFGSVLVEGIDGNIPADYAPQVQMWWVNEQVIGTGEIDPETGDEITEKIGEGTAKLLAVVMYDADGNEIGRNGLTDEELHPTPVAPEDPPIKVLIGDVNCDGDVKIGDVILLNRFMAEDESITVKAEGLANADADGDGGIGSGDSVAILKILAGL